MTDHYFVQVMADNGEVLRWEALTKEQADFIFKQEVEKNGAENCTTGLTREEANCNWPHRWQTFKVILTQKGALLPFFTSIGFLK